MLGAAPLGAIGLAVAVAVFAYDGYAPQSISARRCTTRPRRLSRAILITLVITVLAEVIPLIAVLTGAPDLARLLQARSIFSSFVAEAGGAGLATVLGAGVGLAIINAVIALVLLTARQLYSTGRDETWPGRRARC